MSKPELQREINRINNEIALLEFQKCKLAEELAAIESREYLEKHPMYLIEKTGNQFKNFRELRLHFECSCTTKPWVEWKGRIYRIEDIWSGFNKPTPARLCDLEEMEAIK